MKKQKVKDICSVTIGDTEMVAVLFSNKIKFVNVKSGSVKKVNSVGVKAGLSQPKLSHICNKGKNSVFVLFENDSMAKILVWSGQKLEAKKDVDIKYAQHADMCFVPSKALAISHAEKPSVLAVLCEYSTVVWEVTDRDIKGMGVARCVEYSPGLDAVLVLSGSGGRVLVLNSASGRHLQTLALSGVSNPHCAVTYKDQVFVQHAHSTIKHKMICLYELI